MLTAGLDIGLESIKIVVLRDGEIVAKGIDCAGGAGRAENVKKLWESVLSSSGFGADEIVKTVSTGQGKLDVEFACKNVVEPVAAARAARFANASVTAVMDAGANQTRVVFLKEDGTIHEVVQNQKCMAGLGMLVEIVADRLGMTLEEISVLETDAEALLNDGCPVFIELDMLEQLNNQTPRESIAKAAMRAVSVRLNSILNDKIKPQKETMVLMGGVGLNTSLVKMLSLRSGINFIVPEWTQYGGAVGAALLAADLAS